MPRLPKFLVSLVACLLLSGCGGSEAQNTEEAIEDYAASQGIDADVEMGDDGQVDSMTIDQGALGISTTTGRNVALPDGFPDDVAVYPDLNVIAASSIPQGFSVQGTTEDSQDEVAEHFQEQMLANGWTEAESTTAGPIRQLSFEKDGRRAGVNLMPANPGTMVQLSVLTLDG